MTESEPTAPPRQLDLRRLLCPLPVLRTQKAVESMRSGELLELLCTDPGVLHDIPTWCRINGHRVLSCEREERQIRILIQSK